MVPPDRRVVNDEVSTWVTRRWNLLGVVGVSLLLLVGCTRSDTTTRPTTGPATTVQDAASPPVTHPAGPPVTAQWSKTMSGPTNEDEIDGVAAAPDASVYVTGQFVGSTTLGGKVLQSAGAADIPVAHFDADGTTLWVKRFGGTGEDNLFDADATSAGMVGTGWFTGTVDFGGVVLESAGKTDCVIVSLKPDGTTRWASRFGGSGFDGCNEVALTPDGRITTSVDTQGEWQPAGQQALPAIPGGDTMLLRISPDGNPVWMRRVGGPKRQRGKSIAVAPDGSVSFGGDTTGALAIEGHNPPMPAHGGQRDAWISRWTSDGSLEWVHTWGGPGSEMTKGVVDDGQNVTMVGPFTGTVSLGGHTFDAAKAGDLVVAQWSVSGRNRWATKVSAPGLVMGAEVIGAPDGGVLFGTRGVADMHFGSTNGHGLELSDDDAGTALIAHYSPDGVPLFAEPIAGTDNGIGGEIARTGNRIYLDVILFTATGPSEDVRRKPFDKDASVWALDVVAG